MIVTRGLHLVKLTNYTAKNFLLRYERNNLNKQLVRNSSGELYYRKCPPIFYKKDMLLCEIAGTLVWWYILWNLLTNYSELIGFTFPDPSKWTDEELGVPPIDD